MPNTFSWRVWWMAARPKTLPAAITPVLVGTTAALHDSSFSLFPFVATILAALLIQIGTNLANDVFDYQKGADTGDRLGPARVTQQGLLSPRQVLLGTVIVFGLAALIGLYLIWLRGLPILIIGVLSILAGLAYTGGPYPLGYNGLGDIFVFLFFGLAAVTGSALVQSGQVTSLAWIASIPVGNLITALIVVNNLRDVPTDRKAGKRTLAVRFGEPFARWEFTLLTALAFLIPLLQTIADPHLWPVMLSWISLPIAIQVTRLIWTQTGMALNRALEGCGRLILVFGVLYSLGLLICSL